MEPRNREEGGKDGHLVGIHKRRQINTKSREKRGTKGT